MDSEIVKWAVYIFPVTRSLEFFLGVAVGFLFVRGLRVRLSPHLAAIVAVAAMLAASFAPPGLRMAAVTLVPFAFLILSVASSDQNGRHSVFNTRVAVALGAWSYCFYLLHAMIQGWVIKAAGLFGVPALSGLLLSVPLAIAAAWALHAFVEKPFEKRLRPRGASKRLDDD